jgi:hypothetical protein
MEGMDLKCCYTAVDTCCVGGSRFASVEGRISESREMSCWFSVTSAQICRRPTKNRKDRSKPWAGKVRGLESNLIAPRIWLTTVDLTSTIHAYRDGARISNSSPAVWARTTEVEVDSGRCWCGWTFYNLRSNKTDVGKGDHWRMGTLGEEQKWSRWS